MSLMAFSTHHLVKSEDLNHHGTLYAGRTAEWFVESGFVAAASLTKPENVVCLKIHGMRFSRPVQRGDLICFTSRIAHAGTTSLVAHIKSEVKGEIVVEGFITFIHVDINGKTFPHGVTVVPESEEEIALNTQAKSLPR